MPFRTAGSTRRYQSCHPTSRREYRDQYAPGRIRAKAYEPLLAIRVWIRDSPAHWIVKRKRGISKAHAMLPEVRRRLSRISFTLSWFNCMHSCALASRPAGTCGDASTGIGRRYCSASHHGCRRASPSPHRISPSHGDTRCSMPRASPIVRTSAKARTLLAGHSSRSRAAAASRIRPLVTTSSTSSSRSGITECSPKRQPSGSPAASDRSCCATVGLSPGRHVADLRKGGAASQPLPHGGRQSEPYECIASRSATQTACGAVARLRGAGTSATSGPKTPS